MRLSSEEQLQISDIAKMLGITARTIRLYEQMGLVDPPQRTEGGIRFYAREDLKRFKFILRLKDLGLSLQEMQELAQIYREHLVPEKIMPRLLEQLEEHLAGIKRKVRQLQSLEKEISEYKERIAALCDQSSPASG